MKFRLFFAMLSLLISSDIWASSFSWKIWAHKLLGSEISVAVFVEHPGHRWTALRAAADCTAQGAAFIDAGIDLREPIHRRAIEDYENGIKVWTRKTIDKEFRNAVFDYIAAEMAIVNSDEMKSYIRDCATERGYGFDIMSTQGAINWTKDRINEYREYLPRLWCNEEVFSWMSANDLEAKIVLPKLEAAISAGVQEHYEFSPVDRPLYLEYKNLEAMHQNVYDDEGHVFRSAADVCDRMPRPADIGTLMMPEQALKTCDVLGFQRGTDSHSNCALKLLTED